VVDDHSLSERSTEVRWHTDRAERQQYRDALRASYVNSVGTTIQYSDPLNSPAIAVHFDSYSELIYDLWVQQVALSTNNSPALSYEVEIVLVEA